MARGRFLSASISRNERLSSLASDRFRLAWFYALPHADRDGHLPGDAHELGCLCYASLLTSHAWSQGDVLPAIEALEVAGLWLRGVDAEGRQVIRIERFNKHQEGMRYDRERESEFKEPIKWSDESRSPAVAGHFRQLPEASGSSSRVTSREVEEEAQERTRARKSEERAENELKTPPPSGARLQEWAATRPQVLADFRAALQREEWEPSRIDESAAREASGLLSALKDRRAQFVKSLAVLDEDGRAHPHKLADVIQVLRNGDHERKRTPMDHYAALDRKLSEDTEKILAERRSWAKG